MPYPATVVIIAAIAIITLIVVGMRATLKRNLRAIEDKYDKKSADRYADDIGDNPSVVGFAVLKGDSDVNFPEDAWIEMVEAANPEHTDIIIVLALDGDDIRVAIDENYVYRVTSHWVSKRDNSIIYRCRRSKHHDKLFRPILDFE